MSDDGSGFDRVVQMIGGKWKLVILRQLIFSGPKRFGELRRDTIGITQTMLTAQLRALESDGLVHRKAHAEVPPRVVYSATPLATGLTGLFKEMHKWATTNGLSEAAVTPVDR